MFDKIKKAVNTIMSGDASRIDGDLWTVYAVGSTTIRVDLKVNKISDLMLSGKMDDEFVIYP